jgi:hypothetical protein
MEETKCIQKGSMRQGVIDFLMYIPLFDQLEADGLENAERYMNLVEIHKDEVCFKEGEIRYNFHQEKTRDVYEGKESGNGFVSTGCFKTLRGLPHSHKRHRRWKEHSIL